MPDPFMIICAPNGAKKTRFDHPMLPISPSDLADCAEEIVEAGACMMHMHVRDDQDGHSLSVKKYKEAIQAVTDRVGDALLIQVTTESVGIYSPYEQMEMVKALKPDAISVALREIYSQDMTESDVAGFFKWLRANAVFPQMIVYSEAELAKFLKLYDAGVFTDRKPFVLFVQGKTEEAEEDRKKTLERVSSVLTARYISWAVCGFGAGENILAASAARLGGHVRVGFENNLWMPDGSLAQNNAALVDYARSKALREGRKIATVKGVKALFNLDN